MYVCIYTRTHIYTHVHTQVHTHKYARTCTLVAAEADVDAVGGDHRGALPLGEAIIIAISSIIIAIIISSIIAIIISSVIISVSIY